MQTGNERIELVNVEDEMKNAYIDYSMSVIVGRALPDARDGLKPGNRRILYAMKERGWIHSKAHVKCAKVVGEVIGNYHPHGDQAIYDTLVRMAQDFSMRCLLIDGQGNFGSIDGDNAAAYRYTECRLQSEAEEMLTDIDRDTVDMKPNFDETLNEPTVLPARIPNLLVNGSTGIAVGMATNIPPHNLCEVVDGVVHLVDNPNATPSELHEFVKGPDFPTAGIIHGFGGARDLYETGRGKIRMRARANIEENRKGRVQIIVSEIPYAVNKAQLITKTAKLVQDKKLTGIADIRDESGRDGIRIVYDLKRDAVPSVVLNNLYKHTRLETTFGAIMLAIDHGRPRVMNLRDALTCYIDHRLEVVTRRVRFDLAKAKARAHILEGLKIAIDNLDEVVEIIRQSDDRHQAADKLMARFKLSEKQTKAILDMRLYQLTGLERDKVESEYAEIQKQIAYFEDLLGSELKLKNIVKEDLLEIKEKYGEERRTEMVIDEGEIDIEDLIPDESCVITVSNAGYIKRIPTDTYRQQRRGGKGMIGMKTKDEDFVAHVFSASLHDYLLCFTSAGQMHWLKVYRVPESSRTARGRNIANLLQMGNDEQLASLIRVREFSADRQLVMATANGVVKKTNLSAYGNVRKKSIISIRIDEDDKLVGVKLTEGEDDLILSTYNGKSIRFPESDLRDQGRATRGVRGIRLSDKDQVKAIDVVDQEKTLLVITENGYGKRTKFEEYRSQARGGKGLISIKTSKRNGGVIGAHVVDESDSLVMVTREGQLICIGLDELRPIGRNTQGVRLVRLNEDDKLISTAMLHESEEKDEQSESDRQDSESEGDSVDQ